MPKNHTIHQQTDVAPRAVRTLSPIHLFTHTMPSSSTTATHASHKGTNTPAESPPNAQHQNLIKSHRTASSRTTQRRAAYKKHTGIYCLNGLLSSVCFYIYYTAFYIDCQYNSNTKSTFYSA